MAVDYSGRALSYNGISWTAPIVVDDGNQLDSVSCPTSTFCAAVDNHCNALSYNGISWTTPDIIYGSNQLDSVSCSSSSFCMAVGNGSALSFDGTSWGAPTGFDGRLSISRGQAALSATTSSAARIVSAIF